MHRIHKYGSCRPEDWQLYACNCKIYDVQLHSMMLFTHRMCLCAGVGDGIHMLIQHGYDSAIV